MKEGMEAGPETRSSCKYLDFNIIQIVITDKQFIAIVAWIPYGSEPL